MCSPFHKTWKVSLSTRAGGQLYIQALADRAVGQPVVIRRIYFSLPAAAEQRTRCDARLLGCQTQRDASCTRGNHTREQLYHCQEETSHSSLQLDSS